MKTGARVLVAIAAVAATVLTASLGMWQWGRGQEKDALQAAIDRRASLPPMSERDLAMLGDGTHADAVHRPVVLAGRWDAAHTVFLDNRQMNGRPGFFVVTPLRFATSSGTESAVLVQRGWAPRNFSQRDKLPHVETPAGSVVVRGRLAPPPARLLEFDGAGEGAIRQNLDLAAFRAETKLPLIGLSVLQAGPPSEGLLREWPQPASGSAKNYGYAFQWWALALLIAVLYVWFQFVAPRRARRAR